MNGNVSAQVNPNQAPIDQYTAYHFVWGIALRRMGFGFGGALIASLAWEHVIEPWYKDRYPEVFPAPAQDSAINSAFDTVAVMAGWRLGR